MDRVGVRDNFFSIGGHSLMAMRIMNMLRQRFSFEDQDLSLPILFEHQDVESLARFVYENSQRMSLKKSIDELDAYAEEASEGYV